MLGDAVVSHYRCAQHNCFDGATLARLGVASRGHPVRINSDGLSDEQIARALFTPCRSIEDTVAKLAARYGPAARLCVLPDGPLTIPFD